MSVTICPVEYMVDLVGGKWKILILWHLKIEKKRFSQLQRSLNGVSKKMLSQQLKELEQSGLINREVFPTTPPQVEYSLSETGQRLTVILEDLNNFGNTLLNN